MPSGSWGRPRAGQGASNTAKWKQCRTSCRRRTRGVRRVDVRGAAGICFHASCRKGPRTSPDEVSDRDRRGPGRRRSLRSGRHQRPPGRSARIRAATRRRDHRHGSGGDLLARSAPRKSHGSHSAGCWQPPLSGSLFKEAASPLLHSIGVLFDAVIFTLAYYAVFAFPHGRLVSPLDKLLIAAPLLIVFTSQRAPHRYFIGPLAGRDRDRRRTRNGHPPVPPTVSAAVAALTPQVQTLTRETRSSPSDRSSCGVTLPTRSQRVDDDDVQGDDDECPQRIAG